MPMEIAEKLYVGDIVEMRKPHPCGGKQWEIVAWAQTSASSAAHAAAASFCRAASSRARPSALSCAARWQAPAAATHMTAKIQRDKGAHEESRVGAVFG